MPKNRMVDASPIAMHTSRYKNELVQFVRAMADRGVVHGTYYSMSGDEASYMLSDWAETKRLMTEVVEPRLRERVETSIIQSESSRSR